MRRLAQRPDVLYHANTWRLVIVGAPEMIYGGIRMAAVVTVEFPMTDMAMVVAVAKDTDVTGRKIEKDARPPLTAAV